MCTTTPQRISSSVSDDIKEDASILYNNKLNMKKNDTKIPTILCECLYSCLYLHWWFGIVLSIVVLMYQFIGILVMIDMLSVSLVVPLLHQYYKNVFGASEKACCKSCMKVVMHIPRGVP